MKFLSSPTKCLSVSPFPVMSRITLPQFWREFIRGLWAKLDVSGILGSVSVAPHQQSTGMNPNLCSNYGFSFWKTLFSFEGFCFFPERLSFFLFTANYFPWVLTKFGEFEYCKDWQFVVRFNLEANLVWNLAFKSRRKRNGSIYDQQRPTRPLMLICISPGWIGHIDFRWNSRKHFYWIAIWTFKFGHLFSICQNAFSQFILKFHVWETLLMLIISCLMGSTRELWWFLPATESTFIPLPSSPYGVVQTVRDADSGSLRCIFKFQNWILLFSLITIKPPHIHSDKVYHM